MKFLLSLSSVLRHNRIFKNNFNQVNSFRNMSGISLQEAVKKLEEFASLDLGEKWDNIGLLIEPFTPKQVKKLLLTNDLTEVVLQEAIEHKTDLIVSYHPPIFQSLKRITMKSWKERIVAGCLEHRIAVYSPHTAWDSVPGGVNDWLLKALPIETSHPITPDAINPEAGSGRFGKLSKAITLRDAIDRVKKHIGIEHVHVAIAQGQSLDAQIKTVGICAGSGSSVLLKPVIADLYLTGEMSHHEVLAAIHQNANVILCNHSNSERGFLREFKDIFSGKLDGSVEIEISAVDVDPLKTY